MVPDKDGQMRDVVLGFDSIQDYISKPSDFGARIGRYANRINQGKFTLDGVEYQLPRNNYGHCLHGRYFQDKEDLLKQAYLMENDKFMRVVLQRMELIRNQSTGCTQ